MDLTVLFRLCPNLTSRSKSVGEADQKWIHEGAISERNVQRILSHKNHNCPQHHLSPSPLWWEAVKQGQGLEAISVQPRLTLPLQQCICTPLLPHSAPQCHTLPHTSLPHTIIATQLHTCFLTISVCTVHVRTLLLLCSSHTLTIYPDACLYCSQI